MAESHEAGSTARNLEIKVRCGPEGLSPVIARAYAAGIGPFTTLFQTDTYFAVPIDRLKVRKIQSGSDQTSELIAYSRPDKTGPRDSRYHRVTLAAESVDSLIAA